MIQAWVAWSARWPRLVVALAVVLATLGGLAWQQLQRDALPDLSDPRVVVFADWMGHPATEVNARVTQPWTAA